MQDATRPIRVDVDTGTIQIALREAWLEAGLNFFSKVSDQSLYTAQVSWDGRKGAIKTPHGDGPHLVQMRIMHNDEWNPYVREIKAAWPDSFGAFLSNHPAGHVAPGFRIFFGDLRADGVLDFPEHNLISFYWLNGGHLEFQVAQEDRSPKAWRPGRPI